MAEGTYAKSKRCRKGNGNSGLRFYLHQSVNSAYAVKREHDGNDTKDNDQRYRDVT